MIQVSAARQGLLDIAIQALTIMNTLSSRSRTEPIADDVASAICDILGDLESIAERVTEPEEFPDLDALMEKS